MADDTLFARHGIVLPLRLSDDPDEFGCVRDARGREVFVVNLTGKWSDVATLAVAARLCRAANGAMDARARPDAVTALESISAILRPVADSDEATMAAFEIAEDALAALRQGAAQDQP